MPNGECLEWSGATNDKGYGLTKVNGKITYTHRLALVLEGFNVLNKFVIHSCDNPLCANAKHLSLGDQWDNMADCVSKQRQSSKISEKQCLEIKQHLNEGQLYQWEIGEMYGITQSQVSRINTGINWNHLQQ